MKKGIVTDITEPRILIIPDNRDISELSYSKLTYKNGYLVSIIAEYIFDEIDERDSVTLLIEFRRVLHMHGALYVKTNLQEKKLRSLKRLIKEASFSHIDNRDHFVIYASNTPVQHQIDPPLTDDEFLSKCKYFKKKYLDPIPATYIITVCNEENNLPHFIVFLENTKDNTGAEREFIFVLNGCSDKSEEILVKYTKKSCLNIKIAHSEIAILNAFKTGIRSRTLNGFIGRLDADIILHPHTLDLMQIFLHENNGTHVTYSEPVTFQSLTEFNQPVYEPEIMSKRLYYTGKTSLYRNNPNLIYKNMTKDLIADDIFSSFHLVYYYGFDAIARTPNALIYENVIDNFDDLVSQLSRSYSEIKRIFKSFPHLEPLGKIMEQNINPSSKYFDLISKAERKKKYINNWTRLESTK